MKYGDGPTLVIGNFKSESQDVKTGEIRISYKYIQKLEAVDGGNTKELAFESLAMAFYILHEFSHYGDKETNGGVYSGQSVKNSDDLEEGAQNQKKSPTGHRGTDIESIILNENYNDRTGSIPGVQGEDGYPTGETSPSGRANILNSKFWNTHTPDQILKMLGLDLEREKRKSGYNINKK